MLIPNCCTTDAVGDRENGKPSVRHLTQSIAEPSHPRSGDGRSFGASISVGPRPLPTLVPAGPCSTDRAPIWLWKQRATARQIAVAACACRPAVLHA